MKLPSFSELDDEQQHVYQQPPDASILVVGPPGSGKTSMAIWRARVLSGPDLGRSVTLVTRNRLLTAAAERLALEQDGSAINATTMNQLVWRDYKGRFNRSAPQWRPYEYRWDLILQQYETAGVQPLVDHMIIDEGQNLPPGFFQWAMRFGARTVSIFADEAQSTHAEGSTMRDFGALGFTEALPLKINHRNTAEIVDLLEQLHVGTVPRPAPARGGGTGRPRIVALTSWEDLANMVHSRFVNRSESIGVIVYQQVDVNHMHDLLRERLPRRARVDSYTSNSVKGAEYAIRMHEPGVTILSGESAIGLEFDTLYLQDLDRSLPFADPMQRRRIYMLCARARDNLVLINGPRPLNTAQLQALPATRYLNR